LRGCRDHGAREHRPGPWAAERGADAARDLPSAEKLAELLYAESLVDRRVNPLLAEPTDQQARLIDEEVETLG
jgi:hypothetical protein